MKMHLCCFYFVTPTPLMGMENEPPPIMSNSVARISNTFSFRNELYTKVGGCLSVIQGYRKRWTGFETAITQKVLDGFTRLAS